ncbi:MAG: twin-arginine translocase subunit TatB [Rhodospirillaceae bacterium]|nr:twin-arginine translocase subunit TatB [Rhodospirillaceae bacterium]
MFDIGWQELFILAVLAIIVVGPKDLPRAIKTVTYWIRKARSMARDLQDGLDDVVREAELDEIKKEANKMMDGEGLDPSGTLAKEFDMTDIQQDWSGAVEDLKSSTDPSAKDPVDDDVIDDISGLDEDLDDGFDDGLDDDPDLMDPTSTPVETAEIMPESGPQSGPEKTPSETKG